ncbi:MAG: T9SS type A sorting domain-containing protein [Bacteroidales bacterium]|nr:T9SS type A sorting domain-containing protein [Bacteroidales bacterium]MDD4178218.1 T9SS type A sorting domain-containing protein [Bacteroidales bacterium]NCU36251.1 T9SS type A sorting domain-containing protein [Candidatus Falkowbacteria bacterium]
MKYQQHLLAVLFLLHFFSLKLHADSIEVGGLVSGVWNVDTVFVTDNLRIREITTLEIAPGTLVLFNGSFHIHVDGRLLAQGTPDEPITFTVADTTGFSNDTLPLGGWQQIRMQSIATSEDSSVFTFCHFRYGKAVATDSLFSYGGAFCIRNTDKVRIENCSFYRNYAFYNGGAIYLEQSNIAIRNNYFEDNHCGQTFDYFGYGGALCSDNGVPDIGHNHFRLNRSTGIGGAVCIRFSDCPLHHNIFDENFSALGGAFGIMHIIVCRYAIHNNLVINNGAEFFGAGISNNNSSPLYVNNTIADNHCTGGGGGFYCKDSVAPVLYNNILWGNTQYGGQSNQVYLWDLLSQPSFFYNDVEGGKENFAGTGGSAYSASYEYNLDTVPLFQGETYHLLPLSGCVETGTPDTTGLLIPAFDLAHQPRLVGTRIDMGAYENQNPVAVSEPKSSNQIMLFDPAPNPATDRVEIQFYLPAAQDHITLQIVDLQGKLIATPFTGMASAGHHKLSWHPALENTKTGIYFCVLIFDAFRATKKLVVE